MMVDDSEDGQRNVGPAPAQMQNEALRQRHHNKIPRPMPAMAMPMAMPRFLINQREMTGRCGRSPTPVMPMANTRP